MVIFLFTANYCHEKNTLLSITPTTVTNIISANIKHAITNKHNCHKILLQILYMHIYNIILILFGIRHFVSYNFF